jgi:hypothetical protein
MSEESLETVMTSRLRDLTESTEAEPEGRDDTHQGCNCCLFGSRLYEMRSNQARCCVGRHGLSRRKVRPYCTHGNDGARAYVMRSSDTARSIGLSRRKVRPYCTHGNANDGTRIYVMRSSDTARSNVYRTEQKKERTAILHTWQ